MSKRPSTQKSNQREKTKQDTVDPIPPFSDQAILQTMAVYLGENVGTRVTRQVRDRLKKYFVDCVDTWCHALIETSENTSTTKSQTPFSKRLRVEHLYRFIRSQSTPGLFPILTNIMLPSQTVFNEKFRSKYLETLQISINNAHVPTISKDEEKAFHKEHKCLVQPMKTYFIDRYMRTANADGCYKFPIFALVFINKKIDERMLELELKPGDRQRYNEQIATERSQKIRGSLWELVETKKLLHGLLKEEMAARWKKFSGDPVYPLLDRTYPDVIKKSEHVMNILRLRDETEQRKARLREDRESAKRANRRPEDFPASKSE